MSSDTLQGADRSPASAPYSAFSHIDSLRNENSLAPLALAHLSVVKNLCGQGTRASHRVVEWNDLDEG